MRKNAYAWTLVGLLFLTAYRPQVSELYASFRQIPDSTRTKVWWFHGKAVGADSVFSRPWWNNLIFAASEAKNVLA